MAMRWHRRCGNEATKSLHCWKRRCIRPCTDCRTTGTFRLGKSWWANAASVLTTIWNLPGGRLALPQALYASYTTAYLGFMPKSFFSTDYFPLLPWLFLFWAGYFLHHLVGRGRLAPLRRSVCPPLGWMGRHSLVLYLLHQPVILGVLTVAFRLVRAG